MSPSGNDLGDQFFIDSFLNQSFGRIDALGFRDLLFQFRDHTVLQFGGIFISGLILSLFQIKFGLFQQFTVFLAGIKLPLFILPL